MKLRTIAILIISGSMAVSCFKEDQAVPPYIPPENVETISLQSSLYEYQIYFDLNTGEIREENKNSAWELAFECGVNGWHIRINSSGYWGVAQTGSTNFDSTFSDKTLYTWAFDKSDGNPDSTAIGKWVNFDSGLAVYSNEVYLIGKYNGITYEPQKKVQFLHNDDNSYKFIVSGLNENNTDTVQVSKQDDFNYVHYSFHENRIMILEPDKNDWDILFTQYSSVLYTDEGVPTPYFVRGVLQNPYKTESILDTITDFNKIGYSYAEMSTFSIKQDAIGYDWKEVKVDEGSNSAEYKVRKGYTYIIKDTRSGFYKLRFTSYFNQSGIRGYPSFEFTKLLP